MNRPHWLRTMLRFSLGLMALVGALVFVPLAPVAKLVLACVGTLAVITLGFWKKVWGELEPTWAKGCAGWINAHTTIALQTRLSGFRRRYFEQLQYRHRLFNVRGLRTQGTFTLELEKVFVDVTIIPREPLGLSSAGPFSPPLPERCGLWEFLWMELPEFQSLAIIGPPGCGKTTLLQHLALAFINNKQDRRCRRLIPGLLFLRQHVAKILGNPSISLPELVTELETLEGTNPPKEWFRLQMESGNCLLLLDGLDEVADQTSRAKIVSWVDKQVARYGRCHFVITSRPHGFFSNPLARCTILQVQPFNWTQIERFVRSWYLANEILSFGGRNDAGIRAKAVKDAGILLGKLRDSARIAALAVNPLLLTMVAMVHRYRGQLPGRRVELYSEICDVLLQHWGQAKDRTQTAATSQSSHPTSVTLTAQQKRVVLEPLAFFMMQNNRRELDAKAAAEAIKESLIEVGWQSNDDPIRFLEEVERDSGLLVEREVGVYSFAHLTFQEYLAACHILGANQERLLISHVADSWWHETIRLFAAQADATNIIQACLEARDPHGGSAATNISCLTLAYECLSEARKVAPATRKHVIDEIIVGMESPNAEHRIIAAEVMLQTRLHQLVRLNEFTDIDLTYVSVAEYQLFLNERLQMGEHTTPDHWSKNQFPAGRGRTPIAGIRYQDASLFCDWLNKRVQKEPGAKKLFRLPSHSEANENPVGNVHREDLFRDLVSETIGTWCQNPPDVVGIRSELKADWTKQFQHYLIQVVESEKESISILEELEFKSSSTRWVEKLAKSRDCAKDLSVTVDLAVPRIPGHLEGLSVVPDIGALLLQIKKPKEDQVAALSADHLEPMAGPFQSDSWIMRVRERIKDYIGNYSDWIRRQWRKWFSPASNDGLRGYLSQPPLLIDAKPSSSTKCIERVVGRENTRRAVTLLNELLRF